MCELSEPQELLFGAAPVSVLLACKSVLPHCMQNLLDTVRSETGMASRRVTGYQVALSCLVCMLARLHARLFLRATWSDCSLDTRRVVACATAPSYWFLCHLGLPLCLATSRN